MITCLFFFIIMFSKANENKVRINYFGEMSLTKQEIDFTQ